MQLKYSVRESCRNQLIIFCLNASTLSFIIFKMRGKWSNQHRSDSPDRKRTVFFHGHLNFDLKSLKWQNMVKIFALGASVSQNPPPGI